MGLIKKIKQKIKGDWLELTLDSKEVTNLNLENGEGVDSIVQKYSGVVDDSHYSNICTGESATVFGEANNNSGNRSLVAGKLNINAGKQNFVSGIENSVGETHNIIVAGANNIVDNANQSAIFGMSNDVKNGQCITAFGYDNTASADFSFTVGQGNTVSNLGSIAGGTTNTSSGVASVALGANNKATGNYAIAMGNNSNATNNGIAIGSYCDADQYGVSMGISTTTYGAYGIAIGIGTETHGMQAAFGTYNDRNDNAILIVGNGSGGGSTPRTNAFVVMKDGRAKVYGDPTEVNDVVTKGWIDEKLAGDQIFKNVTISGGLEVQGTVTTVNQETLTINDNIIVTNAYGGMTPYTGVVAVTGNKIYTLKTGDYTTISYEQLEQLNGADLYYMGVLSCDITYNGRKYNKISMESHLIHAFHLENDITGDFDVVSGPVVFTINSDLILSDASLDKTFWETILINPNMEAADEAYAAAIYNLIDHEIQLGLGYVTRDNDNRIDFDFYKGENQALATRSSNIADGHFVKWDNTKKQLVDGGALEYAAAADIASILWA